MRKFNKTICTAGLVFVLTLLIAPDVFSQFYYKDIVSLHQINETFRMYREGKISKITLNSFQGNTPVTEGFVCEQRVNLPASEVVTYTKTLDVGETYFTARYNRKGLLSTTVDSSQESISTAVYTYDEANRVVAINYSTRAADNSSVLKETHLWKYQSSGKPQQLVRIKNNTDSSMVSFVIDEKGNVAEENISGRNTLPQKYFYYYDDKNQLTDVVRYNAKAKRLLPDYIFEYEDSGEIATMTVVPEGSSDYQKYFYKYDDIGLKIIEFCYNKKNQLLGKVEYKYTRGR